MSALSLIVHEAWFEFRSGLRSGIVTLVFLGLIAYLLMVLANAEYVQEMGATDIPRNAPSLIYLMSSGCLFFLFFAWAWVFAQPLLRDRKAMLQEAVLSTPNSLQALLWGRFIGAVMVAALLSGSLIVGFVVTPVLQWVGLVAPDSIAPLPWQALMFSWFWLLIPIGAGIGALYFLATLHTRSIAGALGLSSLLMLLWMFAAVVLKGGQINPMLATSLDPSLFTFVLAQVETWTPQQKATAFLPLTPAFLLNRALWCLLPLFTLTLVLRRIQRESLVLENARKPEPGHKMRGKEALNIVAVEQLPGAILLTRRTQRWWRALALETCWQLHWVFRSRTWWVSVGILLMMGIASSFTRIIWHAEGPMVPRLGMILPLLNEAMFLVIAFMVAGLAGLICRRDDVLGFDTLLDTTPAPDFLRLLARVLTVIVATLVLALSPGLSSLVVMALAAPSGLDPAFPLLYQTLVSAPPLLELALLVLLMHALVRRAGAAYAASMLLTFILVVNHEVALVSYPPFEVGIPAHVNLSALTGWAPWLSYLVTLDAYKLALCVLLIALAAIVLPRGLDSRLRGGLAQARARLLGPQGILALVAIVSMWNLSAFLEKKLVVEGGYLSAEQTRQSDASWEKRWLSQPPGAFTVAGGELRVDIDPAARTLVGHWLLRQVTADKGYLHAELPHGLLLQKALVNDREVMAEIGNDHLALPLGDCANNGCEVRLSWVLEPHGWSAEGKPTWLTRNGFWLRAEDVAPRLGLDPERILRAPSERERYGLDSDIRLPDGRASVPSDAVAPAGHWQWQVAITAIGHQAGSTTGPLNFAAFWAPKASRAQALGMTVIYDDSRAETAQAVLQDVSDMRACVSRRLGVHIDVRQVAQWPRGQGGTHFSGDILQLAEAPHWDVAENGVGRWIRRAQIGSALARHQLVETTDLRSASGALWLTEGVAGAIGLLCVGDVDGVNALRQILLRYTDATTRALAASEVPVGPLASALEESWALHYAPLAALDWTGQQTPSGFDVLLNEIRRRQDVAAALIALTGEARAARMLGTPLASNVVVRQESDRIRIDGTRWRWLNTGWQALSTKPNYHLWTRVNGTLRHGMTAKDGISARHLQRVPGLLLDAWPSYERSPTVIEGW